MRRKATPRWAASRRRLFARPPQTPDSAIFTVDASAGVVANPSTHPPGAPSVPLLTFERLSAARAYPNDVRQPSLDLLVGGNLIVEAKAVEALAPVHEAQLLTYMELARRPLGLLLNFHNPKLSDGIRRLVL